MVRFLVAGAVAAGLFRLGRRVLGGYPQAPIALASLGRREHATVVAAALAVFPRGGAIEPSGVDADLPARVDRFLSVQSPATRRLIHLLLLLVEQATLIFPAPGAGGRRRFSRLSPEQQARVLDGWRRSRLFARRLVFTSLRAVLTIAYLSDPGVLRELGLAPRAIAVRLCEADLLWPAIGQPPSSLRLTAADLGAPSDGVPLGPSGPLDPGYPAETARVTR